MNIKLMLPSLFFAIVLISCKKEVIILNCPEEKVVDAKVFPNEFESFDPYTNINGLKFVNETNDSILVSMNQENFSTPIRFLEEITCPQDTISKVELYFHSIQKSYGYGGTPKEIFILYHSSLESYELLGNAEISYYAYFRIQILNYNINIRMTPKILNSDNYMDISSDWTVIDEYKIENHSLNYEDVSVFNPPGTNGIVYFKKDFGIVGFESDEGSKWILKEIYK